MITTYHGNKTRAVRYSTTSWTIYTRAAVELDLQGEEGALMQRNVDTGQRVHGFETPDFADYLDRVIATYEQRAE